jgi:molybdopterin synthase catalytic subunit
VPVAEISVGVAVSAPHRDEAFASARFLIDELKAKAPIWKKPRRPFGRRSIGRVGRNGSRSNLRVPGRMSPASLLVWLH